MKLKIALVFPHFALASDPRDLRKTKQSVNFAPLRLPPPHLRVSYFYPTDFHNSEAVPPAFIEAPAPYFPPMMQIKTDNYLQDLLLALDYPALAFTSPSSPGQSYPNYFPETNQQPAPPNYSGPSPGVPPRSGPGSPNLRPQNPPQDGNPPHDAPLPPTVSLPPSLVQRP